MSHTTTETALVFDDQGRVIWYHLPPDRTRSFLPDSRDLWEVMWKHRDILGGVAHTHPWHGPANPSQTDTTTWVACEAGLGKRLLWPIVTFSEVGYYVHNAVTGLYCLAGPLTIEVSGLDRLRDLSKGVG